ncbi:MAG: CAP domain-containing protein [Bacteroidia bacterium]
MNHMRFSFLILFLIINFLVSAQNDPSKEIEVNNFSEETLTKSIIDKLNEIRKTAKLDPLRDNEILKKASADHATYMAKNEKADPNQSGKKATVGKRVKYYGGSEKASELIIALPIGKGKSNFTYDKIAEDAIAKWQKSKVDKPLLTDAKFVYAGYAAKLDKEKKKVYISVVLGGFDSFNEGASKKARKELTIPYTTKKYGLKPAQDAKACKNCDKFKNIEDLQQGLYVKDGNIYFKHDNVKILKKLLKGSSDGLAVDIVQREQFKCDKPYNIYDNNRVNRGVMTKKMYAPKIFAKNTLLKEDKKSKKLNVMLGKLPKGIGDDYELNLIIIQNNQVCKNITPRYYGDGKAQSSTPIGILPDTSIQAFDLKSEKQVVSFRVPFTRGKAEYNIKDIEPIIKSLNEPNFIINNVKIYAYTSIEGSEEQNAALQKKRAESIVKALEQMQNKKLPKEIITSDTWEMFKNDVKGTNFEVLSTMESKEQALKEIKAKGWLKELEPILEKHRFGQVEIDAKFDLSTKENEQKFVVNTQKKAIDKANPEKALAVQKYAIQKIEKGEYPISVITSVDYPNTAEYAKHNNNKIWAEEYGSKDVDSLNCVKIDELLKFNSDNKIFKFNQVYCFIKNGELTSTSDIAKWQKVIDGLYGSEIPKKTVDGLNLEFQFKVIDTYDTTEAGDAIVEAATNKIKSFFNLEEATWQNAYKLALVFMQHKDPKFALSLMEPFIENKKVSKNFVFTYVGLCTNFKEKIMSDSFVKAMRIAAKKDKDRYCKLFGAPNLSFQILENPFIKEDYCKICGGK